VEQPARQYIAGRGGVGKVAAAKPSGGRRWRPGARFGTWERCGCRRAVELQPGVRRLAMAATGDRQRDGNPSQAAGHRGRSGRRGLIRGSAARYLPHPPVAGVAAGRGAVHPGGAVGERGWLGRIPLVWSRRCGQVAATGLVAFSAQLYQPPRPPLICTSQAQTRLGGAGRVVAIVAPPSGSARARRRVGTGDLVWGRTPGQQPRPHPPGVAPRHSQRHREDTDGLASRSTPCRGVTPPPARRHVLGLNEGRTTTCLVGRSLEGLWHSGRGLEFWSASRRVAQSQPARPGCALRSRFRLHGGDAPTVAMPPCCGGTSQAWMEQNEPLRAVGPCSAGPIAATITSSPAHQCHRDAVARRGRRVNDGRMLTLGGTRVARQRVPLPGRSRRRSRGQVPRQQRRVAAAVGGTAVEQQDGGATAVTVYQDVGLVGRASAAADVGAAAAATIGAVRSGPVTSPSRIRCSSARPADGACETTVRSTTTPITAATTKPTRSSTAQPCDRLPDHGLASTSR
jgi:hypothetical protein